MARRTTKRPAADPNAPLRAVVYVRMSRLKAGDTKGSIRSTEVNLDTQREGCRKAVAALGGVVVAEEHDVLSGDRADRPGLWRAIDRIKAGEANALVVYALDRLSRDQTQSAALVLELRRAGGRLVSATENLEDGPIGDFLRSAYTLADALELHKARERTVRGIDARFRKPGKLKPGSKPPYGYAKLGTGADAAYVENPVEAAVVRRIFAEAAAGVSQRKIAQGLDRDGIPSPLGGRWWQTAVSKVLERATYWTGQHEAWCWATERDADNVPRKVQRPAEERYTVPFPVLVEPALAERARRGLERHRWHGARDDRPGTPGLLKGGFARCGTCGRALKVIAPKVGNPRYACTTSDTGVRCAAKPSITRDKLDGPVWDWVERLLADPARAERWVRTTFQPAGDPVAQAKLAAAEAEVADLAAQVAGLLDNFALLTGPVARMAADTLNALNERLAAAEAERDRLAALAAPPAPVTMVGFRIENAFAVADDVVRAMQATRQGPDEPVRSIVAGGATISGGFSPRYAVVPDTLAAKQAALAVLGLEVEVHPEGTGQPRWVATARLPGEKVSSANVNRAPRYSRGSPAGRRRRGIAGRAASAARGAVRPGPSP